MGKIPILTTNMFQTGWNHQPVIDGGTEIGGVKCLD